MSTSLASIQNTVRNITGRKSLDQLSDADLNNFINDFYLYDFPERLKTLKLEKFIEFDLQPNEDTYGPDVYNGGAPNSPNLKEVIFFKPPAYVAGYQIGYHQSPESFFRIWPDLRFREQVASGTGVADATYNGVTSNVPGLPNTFLFTANNTFNSSLNANDNGLGDLTGDVVASPLSTINYQTGAFSVTFKGTIPVGTGITAQYWPYVASRPRDVMFFNQTFKFRPVPDISYSFRIIGQISPTALALQDQIPEFAEWGDLIAYGASLKIFIEQNESELYKNLYPLFREQNNLAMRRGLKQMQNQRAQTPYSENQIGAAAYWPIYPLY